MKKCSFAVEAFFGIPVDYDNWYEHIEVELTDEQFTRYCETLKRWESTEYMGRTHSRLSRPGKHLYSR